MRMRLTTRLFLKNSFMNVEGVTLVSPSHLYIVQILDKILALEYVEYQHCNTRSLWRVPVNEDTLPPITEHNFLITHIKKSTHFCLTCLNTTFCAHARNFYRRSQNLACLKVPRSSGFRGIRGPPPIALGARSATVHRQGLCDFKTPS
jgi:hypothetical protein